MSGNGGISKDFLGFKPLLYGSRDLELVVSSEKLLGCRIIPCFGFALVKCA